MRFGRVIFVLGMLALVGRARGDYVDSARLSLDIANRNLAFAVRDAEDARRALDAAIAEHNAAIDCARAAESHVAALDSIRRDAGVIDRLAADVQGLTQRESQITAALQAAQSRYDQAAAATEAFRTRARADFEALPEYGLSVTSLNEAQQRLDSARRASDEALLIEPRFLRLSERADAIEAELKRLRADPNTPQEYLAQVSNDWIAARSEIGRFRQQWFESDRGIRDAQAQLDRASARRKELEDRFESSLSADPRYRELVDARNGEQNAIAQITVDLHENKKAREQAEQQLATAKAQLADANLNFAAAQQDLAVAQARVAQASARIAGCEQAVRWAEDGVNRAIWQRDAAARDFELAIRDRDRDWEQQGRWQRERDQQSARDREIERRERERREREDEFRRNEQAERDRREQEDHRKRIEQGRQDNERARKELEQRDRERQEREAEFRRQREQQDARDRRDREVAEARQRDDAKREQDAIRQKQQEESRRRDDETRRRSDEQRQRDEEAKKKEADDRAERERQEKQRQSDENDRGKRYSR